MDFPEKNAISKTPTAKQSLFLALIVLVVISVCSWLVSYTANPVSCQPVENPFPAPSGLPNEYQYNPNIVISRVCSFTGKVTRGRTFKQEITQEIIFCLNPNSFWQENGGWDIVISDSASDDCNINFAGVVTPPFHGDNPIFIQGWQFRNENNTGESEGSINGVRKKRGFNFVFNRDDSEKIWNSHYLSPGSIKSDTTKIPRSRGILTITHLELGNLISGDTAWIEYMEFEVKVYLPSE